MKVSALAAAALAVGFAAAQDLTQIPACATTCVATSIPASCNLDPVCICGSAEFIEAISCCVFNACDTQGQQDTLAFAHGVCDPVGLGDSLPASAGCSDNSTSATSTGTDSTATDTDTATETTTDSTATATEATETATESGAEETSSAGESASSAAGSATESVAAATSTGGSPQQTLGMVGAGLLGLAALL